MNRLVYFIIVIFAINIFAQTKNNSSALTDNDDDNSIPKQAGDWHVEVGPPGNDFYQPPPSLEMPSPSEESFQLVSSIAPDYITNITWEQDEDEYVIRAREGNDEYIFKLSSDEELIEIRYNNDHEEFREIAGKLIIEGSRNNVNRDDIPQVTLNLLSDLFPKAPINNTWSASTPFGKRYVVELGEMIFYARPDGQIRAMKLKKRGALSEIEVLGNEMTKEELIANVETRFKPYREKFNFERQIKKLNQDRPKDGEGYRFVVLGDSRSNPELWKAIINHIDQLDPKPKFVINSGDIVPHGFTDEYLEYYIPSLLKTDIPYFVAIGNHDTGINDEVIEYRNLFGENSTNYFFDYGNVRFIFMDNVSDIIPYNKTLGWLETVLNDTPNNYKTIVSAHKPVATVEKWAYHSWGKEYSEVFDELMSKYKVDYVYFGHIHAYSTAEQNGVPYTIAGGGGASLHDRFGPLGNIHHYIICDVSADGSIQQRVVRFRKNK